MASQLEEEATALAELTNKPGDHVSTFVYETYVLPALARGDSEVRVEVADVWMALGRIYSMDSIRNVLASAKFRESYNLFLTPGSPDDGSPTGFAYKLGVTNHHPAFR